jgi:hypothetical protein
MIGRTNKNYKIIIKKKKQREVINEGGTGMKLIRETESTERK